MEQVRTSLLGFLPQALLDPPRFLTALQREGGEVAAFRLLGSKTQRILVSEPSLIRAVLLDGGERYRKSTRILRPLFGEGLLLSDGPTWRRQRLAAQPAFGAVAIESYAETFRAEATALIPTFASLAESGQSFDMARVMMETALRIVAKTLFGAVIEEDLAAMSTAITTVLRHTRLAMFAAVPGGTLRLRLHARKFAAARALLRSTMEKLLAANSESKQASLMQRLAGSYDVSVSNEELMDQAMTFFLAGHETTAAALSWSWYLLARHPVHEDRLHLPHFPRMVLEEAMRLYPPVFMIVRKAVDDHRLGTKEVPANSDVVISPFVMHRLPAFWQDPLRFDPERFHPERRVAITPFSYLPFGAGPRHCIGSHFALREAETILQTLAAHFKFRCVWPRELSPEAMISLRPRGALLMKALRR